MERRLAAILAADMVGYSRHMEADDTNTLSKLKSLRAEIIDPNIAEHHGRMVKTTGDGFLVEFASAAEAVQSAVEIQQSLSERNASVAADDRIEFRIGINVGEIIIEGDDIYGTGVNVAARLEEIAEPGGVHISGTVYDQIENILNLHYEERGEQRVKNISKPVRGYSVRIGAPVTEVPKASAFEEVYCEVPNLPSIVVLPFANMSGDAEQEYFSDGITEDIITTLSRLLGIFVIARTSSFVYKGKAIDIKQVGRDLGVRYVLEGSVRTAQNRVRVTAQLIDAQTGHHLWANRYDGDLTDVFAVQDEITTNVIKALQVQLFEGEQARVWHHSTHDVEAWSCLTRAVMHFNNFTSEENEAARKLLKKALQLDPDYAAAWVWLGQIYWHDVRFLWSSEPEQSLAKAEECAQRAREIDEDYSELHALVGAIHLMNGEFDAALESCRRAVSIDPNGAYVSGFLAFALNWAGRPEEALSLAQKTMRFSPLQPAWYVGVAAHAYRLLERYEDAVALYQRSIKQTPGYISPRIGLTACYAAMGQLEESRAQAAHILRLDPKFSVSRYANALTYRLPEHAQRSLDALRTAGLPE